MRTKEKWLYRGLMIFFGFTIACLYLSVVIGGPLGNPEIYTHYILYIEALITVPIFIYGYNKHSRDLLPHARNWTIAVLAYLFFELINTLLFSFDHSELLVDGVYWLFFFGMFYLGASKQFWKFILSYSVIIVVATMIATIFELTTMNVSYLSMRSHGDESSYIYKIQLGFESIIILLTYYTLTKQKKGTLIAAIAFSLYFILQFFFQKRLPLFRMSLVTVLFLWIVNRSFTASKMLKNSVVMIGVLVLAFSLVPDEYYEATYNRFVSGGSISNTTETDGRYLIAGKAISTTMENPRTFMIGNGLGSFVLGYFYGKEVRVNGRSVEGIGVTEIGLATYFMRYGIIFIFLIYGYLIILLLKRKRYKGNPLSLACWLYLLIFTFMSIIGESFPYVNTPFHTLMVAASMGYLSSYNSRKKHTPLVLDRHSL